MVIKFDFNKLATPAGSEAGYVLPIRMTLLLAISLLFMLLWLLPKFARTEGKVVTPVPVSDSTATEPPSVVPVFPIPTVSPIGF